MEEQIKKIYEKQKNGRIRMIRNVLLIYVALICVVSIFKGNPFPHQETVLFFDVKQPGWVTTDPWLLWICVVVDLIAGIFILIRDILRDFSKIDRILSQQCDAEKYSEMLEELIKYGKSLDYHGFQKSVMLIAESKYVVALIINGQLQKAEEYIKNEWEGKREGRSWQQVMTNLISNAVKYSTDGGFVHVVIEDEEERGIIHVEDGGIGIPQQEQERIFERFYRTDKSRNRRTGGAGIGLTIVKAVVQAHGGTVTVESETGKGSCFTVTLPKEPPEGA